MDETNRTSQANSESYKTNSNAKKMHGMKQVALKIPLKFKGMMQSSVTDHFFNFMLRIFNHINQLYEKEKSLLIYTILKYQPRK